MTDRTPEQIYAEMTAAWSARPDRAEPDWAALAADYAERQHALWTELHDAATASGAPYWASAAALFAAAHAQDHAKTMREHADKAEREARDEVTS